MLADALPDAFGKTVIRAYYTARGDVAKAFSPVQHLLYVGERAIGALEFHPPETPPRRTAEGEALEIGLLVADARRIIGGEAEVAIPEIYRIGSSAGGMRPKAVVHYDAATGAIRSGFATPRPGEVAAGRGARGIPSHGLQRPAPTEGLTGAPLPGPASALTRGPSSRTLF